MYMKQMGMIFESRVLKTYMLLVVYRFTEVEMYYTYQNYHSFRAITRYWFLSPSTLLEILLWSYGAYKMYFIPFIFFTFCYVAALC